MTRRDLFVAAICTLTMAAFTAVAMSRADAVQAEQQTRFEHKACPDCIVMLVNFVPPKP